MAGSLKKTLNNLPRLIFHSAAVVVLAASLVGSFFKQKYRIAVPRSYESSEMQMGMMKSMHGIGFPSLLTLEDFEIDRYPSGAARDYKSTLSLASTDGSRRTIEVSVNHPGTVDGWRLYQTGYDESAGEESFYSVIELVKDPLFPLIAFALWMTIAGGVLLAARTIINSGRKGWLWAIVVGVTAIFIFITMDRVGLGRTDLRPSLRSGWFIPHIVAYMFAYALATLSFISAILALSGSSERFPVQHRMRTCIFTAKAGWAFLSIGMCMGALWAKQSWGDWWTWDIKENWALATWISYALSWHLGGKTKKGWTIALLLISYLLLQMCWWGVNFLPSGGSLHVY